MRRIIIATAVLLATIAGTGPAIPQGAPQVANTNVRALDANGNPFNMGINSNQSANGYYSGVIASESLNAPTTNGTVTITQGLTYQTVFTPGATGPQELIFQNAQISGDDICFILFGQNIVSQIVPGTTTTSTNLTINGNTVTAGGASLILNPGQPYARLFPLVPGDVIFGTCTTTGDSLYVDNQ
jgi:hypothetical protein